MPTSAPLSARTFSLGSAESTRPKPLNAWLDGLTAQVVSRAVESAHGKSNHAENFTAQQLVDEMLQTVPSELWHRKGLALLDPCCGVGNFETGVLRTAAREGLFASKQGALSFAKRALHLCEIQQDSLEFAQTLFEGAVASATLGSFLAEDFKRIWSL